MKSAMRCAVVRICARDIVYATPERSCPFTVSNSLKRTSKRPSGRAATEPRTSASARRVRHSAKLTLDASVGGGLSGGTSSPRNRPLRSRSARTMAEMLAAPEAFAAGFPVTSAPSPAKGAMAIGMRCAPAPVISMESCAFAAPASKNAAAARIRADSLIIAKLYSIVRTELEFQGTLEQFRPVGSGQGRRLEHRALDCLVVARVTARLAQPD